MYHLLREPQQEDSQEGRVESQHLKKEETFGDSE
jgi:hypothetical protein